MSAPFIIHDPNDKTDTQDVVMLLADYSSKTPDAIYAELKKGMPMSSTKPTMTMSEKPDLNDVNYAAFLTHYQTLKNRPVIRVLPGTSG
ncbi:MAG: multicopper oxidase family protein, partial [Gammaproteobacteria bacterium]